MATTMIESLFQRSLQDMVKGLRVQIIGESAYLSKALDEVRKEIKSMDLNTKSVALQKLTYLNMLNGTDMGWAAFHVVEVMSMQQFSLKKLGYLAASQSFTEGTDVLLLITNLLRKDFGGKNEHESSLAIECLSRVATPDLARDLLPELFIMLASGRAHVRKKATAALLRVFSQYPDGIKMAFKRLIERLSDGDPSVITAAVSVLCDLAVKDPKPYLPLAPELYKILIQCPNNWLCIKLVKILGLLAPLEPRLGKKIAEPLCEIMRTSQAKSLLVECVQTVTLGLTEHQDAIMLCIEKVKELMGEDDTNLKYLCLRALGNLVPVHPWAVAENKEVIVKCLNHRDPSIQKGALRLIIGMVSESNLIETVRVLLQYSYNTDTLSCNEILSVILSTCSSDHYALISDFSWYVSVLAEMTCIPNCDCGDEIGRQLIDIALRVRSAVGEVLRAGRYLLLDPALFDRVSIYGVLSAVAWIAGEYVAYSNNSYELVEALLQPRARLLPASVRAVYVQAVLKVFVYSATKFFGEELSSSSVSISEGNHSVAKDIPNEGDAAEDICVKSPVRSKEEHFTEAYTRDSPGENDSGRKTFNFENESRHTMPMFVGENSKNYGEDGFKDGHKQVQQPRRGGVDDWQHVNKDIEDKVRTAEVNVQELITSDEQQAAVESLGSMIDLIGENVTALSTSPDVEVQERVCNLLGLFQVVKEVWTSPCRHYTSQGLNFRALLDVLIGALTVELSPVSVHAQGRVTAPEGLTLENLDALGPIHSKDVATGGSSEREGIRQWEGGKFFSSPYDDSTSQVGESAALLAQHRQRHQKFYLPTETNAESTSSGYPRPQVTHLDPVESPSTSSTGSVHPGDASLWLKKPSRSKSRPVVVKLDDEDDHWESSLKVKKKDLKDEFISKTIMDVLAGGARSFQKDPVTQTAQGLEGWDSFRTRQHRSRGSRSRHSGRHINVDHEAFSSIKNGSERGPALALEVNGEPSELGKGPEHDIQHARYNERALSSGKSGQEGRRPVKLQQSPTRKSKPRRPGGRRPTKPGKELNDTSGLHVSLDMDTKNLL